MGAITKTERWRLEQLEATIEAGGDTFLAVATALAEIRERRLYRASHASFADYCRERWGFGKSAAYRLLATGEVEQARREAGQKVSRARDGSSPPSQRQAEALAALPDHLREQALAAAELPPTRELQQQLEDWRDQEIQEISREEERRLAESRSRPRKQARAILQRIEELTARIEKLLRRLDLADDPEGNEAAAAHFDALAARLRGSEAA